MLRKLQTGKPVAADLLNVQMFTPMKFLFASTYLKSARILIKSNLPHNVIKYFSTLTLGKNTLGKIIPGKLTLEKYPMASW